MQLEMELWAAESNYMCIKKKMLRLMISRNFHFFPRYGPAQQQ